ncbi:HNH endonuclease [Glutamicibacter halophytocola]|uniref:HNH endonuclease n=1 Tax=Glutamicibacter halophytocola TaxID=1933880 RepID=UPI0015C57ECB|nr:HNH endonuclease [Glutamicibacter halophytocola]NQD40562.1 hypothetical protein [Glutamicibacter halophytocola]
MLEYYGRECWLKLPGCTKVATTKDHINPHTHGGSDRLENFRPACHRCNSKRQERKVGNQVRIITGPPAAGKSTYIKEHAYPNDVVVDLDRIAKALMPDPEDAKLQTYPDHIRHVAIGARQAAISRATRLRENVGIWIIHSVPSPDQLEEYKRMGWQIIPIDPGERVVRDRIANQRSSSMHDVADRWYDKPSSGESSPLIEPSRDWGIA